MRAAAGPIGIRRRVVITALALVLVAAACDSDSGDGETDGGDGDRVDNAQVLGSPDPATGEPFRVGFIIDSGGEALDTSEYETAGAAAAEYANEYLGGIGGRPLEITFCENRGTTAGATECVNGFVQDGMSAVLVAASGSGGEVQATLAAESGIPYVAFLGASIAELTDPNSLSMSGAAIAILGSPAVVMEREGLTKLGILTVDVPTATQAVEAFAAGPYEDAGLELELVPVPAGTADMSANVNAVNDAEIWLVLGDSAFCTTAFQALETQAPGVPIIALNQCVTPDNADALPAGYEGITATAANRLDPEDPEAGVFDAVMDEFAAPDDVEAGAPGFLLEGYSTVVGFDRLMEGYTGDGSPETVLEHLSTATGVLPLGGGIEMMCGDSPIPALSSLCSVSAWLIELDAGGDPVGFEQIDVAPFFAG